MKPDESYLLYQKYFSLQNKSIQIVLKDNTVLTGLLIGFFPGDVESGEDFICQWHFVEEKHNRNFGVDAFGFLIGRIIQQEELAEIKFLADGSVMKFDSVSV